MALLRPRIGKVKQYFVERAIRDVLLQHLDRVFAHCAHVHQMLRFAAQQQVTHAWPVHFEADEVSVGVRPGKRDQ